jgi:His-Xaa-Ser repeat protein HxsA
MSRFVRNLSFFLAGIPLLSAKTWSTVVPDANTTTKEEGPVTLRPLNRESDNLFARHSSHASHQSHSSHASHYSGSGSSSPPPAPEAPAYTAPSYPSTPAPAYTAPTYSPPANPSPPSTTPRNTFQPSDSTAPSSRNTPGGSSSNTLPESAPQLSYTEKRKLQVMRVQIKLKTLGIYDGAIDGAMNESTNIALRHFQVLKNLPETGLMSTATLNALGVPAVN